MSTVAVLNNPALEKLEGIPSDYVEQWLDLCHRFKGWHRENILARPPSAEEAKADEQVLGWLIRSTRMVHAQMLDPHWPHQDLAKRVEISLWQLEEAWARTHNPMTELEADALIARFFPIASESSIP